MSCENIHVTEGLCELALPDKLSPDSVSDIEYWLGLIVRRIKRRAHIYSEFLPDVPQRNDDFIPEIPWNFGGL